MSKIKSSKRILAVLLAIIMAFSVMGIVVSADGEGAGSEPFVPEYKPVLQNQTGTLVLDCKTREGTTDLLVTGYSVLVKKEWNVTWVDKNGALQEVKETTYDLDPDSKLISDVASGVVTLKEKWGNGVAIDTIGAIIAAAKDGESVPATDERPVTGIGTSTGDKMDGFVYFDTKEYTSIYNFKIVDGRPVVKDDTEGYVHDSRVSEKKQNPTKGIVMPASYNLIEDNALAGCKGLTAIEYLGTCVQWEKVETSLVFELEYDVDGKATVKTADGITLLIDDKTDHIWHVWKGKEDRKDIEWADDAERYWDEFKYADGNSMHLRYCEICGDEDIKDHTHTYASSKILKDPTCKDTGIIQYICEDCGYIYTEVLPIEEDSHRFGDWQYRDDYTCYMKCTLCGYEEVDQHYLLDTYPVYDRNPDGSIKLDANGDPIWHEENNPWVHDADSHGRICWYCGHMVRRAHNYKYWEEKTFDAYSTTCIQKWRRCDVCGRKEVYGTVGHDFSGPWKSNEDRSFFQSGSMSRTCTQCGEKSPIKISSKFIAPRDTNGDKVVNELDYVPLYRRLLGTSYIGEIFGVPLGAVLFVVDIILGGVGYLKSVFVPHRPIGL